jgi:NAD(P)H-hydrate epimerase
METIGLASLAPRHPDCHKGDVGKILVIAGSETMIGAAAIVGLAAYRTGSGLVRIATSKEILPAVLSICPTATGYAWSGTKLKDLLSVAEEHDVLAVGPGLGQATAVKRMVMELIERHHGPMVLDADALNVLATLDASEWPKRRDWSNIVLTPHMGEYMRLMGAVMKRGAATGSRQEPAAQPAAKPRSLAGDPVERDDAPSTADGMILDLPETEPTEPAPEAEPTPTAPAEPDRTPLAELLAKGTGCIAVLKGRRTIITDGQRVAINETGNSAMATGGAGDVLTGVIASLIGQRMSPLDAAVAGVHIHGMAGDLARTAIGGRQGAGGLIATDIVAQLPRAVATLLPQ